MRLERKRVNEPHPDQSEEFINDSNVFCGWGQKDVEEWLEEIIKQQDEIFKDIKSGKNKGNVPPPPRFEKRKVNLYDGNQGKKEFEYFDKGLIK